MLFNFLILILGFFMLIKGADFLVKGASNIANKFNISDVIIGLTIVSIGTSLPELFISISSASSNFSDLSLGNAIGSNICNLLLILGLASIIHPISININETENYIAFSLFVTVILFAIGNIKGMISITEAIILLICFFLFLIYTITEALKTSNKNNKKDISNSSSSKHIILISFVQIIVGAFLLKYGGDFVTDNAIAIATLLNPAVLAPKLS